MELADTAPAPARCPLCGGPNGCAMAVPRAANGLPPACWCMAAAFPPALLARVPPAARRQACICARCAAAQPPDSPGE
ncbi:MAG: cysteine-rich CWC family protein [Ottowia sp.]|uniref:cysteine-rich CWC family protein n=1 Tax=Ottowia sp. TaxID=1898956 RepID=UPI0039E5B11A